MEYLVELHVKYGDSVLSTCNYEYKEWQEQGMVGGCLGLHSSPEDGSMSSLWSCYTKLYCLLVGHLKLT